MPALGCPVFLALRKEEERMDEGLSALKDGKREVTGVEMGGVEEGPVKRRKGEGLCMCPALLCTLFKTRVHFVM